MVILNRTAVHSTSATLPFSSKMVSSTHPKRACRHPNRHPAALSSPQAPLRPRRSSCRPKREDSEAPGHREGPAPPSGPTITSHSRSVHFDVAEKSDFITICMLFKPESSIPSESQSRGSGSPRDSSPILVEAIRTTKVEPRISTSGGWKSEDSGSMSLQQTSKEATPSAKRSVPYKTDPRTHADDGTE